MLASHSLLAEHSNWRRKNSISAVMQHTAGTSHSVPHTSLTGVLITYSLHIQSRMETAEDCAVVLQRNHCEALSWWRGLDRGGQRAEPSSAEFWISWNGNKMRKKSLIVHPMIKPGPRLNTVQLPRLFWPFIRYKVLSTKTPASNEKGDQAPAEIYRDVFPSHALIPGWWGTDKT